MKNLSEKLKPIKNLVSKIIPLLLFISFLAIFILILWKVPQLQVSNLSGSLDDPTKAAELEDKFRSTLAQLLGGVVLMLGLYLTHRRVTATEKTVAITQEGQITERFTRAIEHLGSAGQELRLGGIYALERIANESEKDHWPIMEILTAFIRKNSLNNNINGDEKTEGEKLSIDTQAALDVLRRRNREHEKKEFRLFDLSDTYLAGANLGGAHLEGAHLLGADLGCADLKEANLRKANLEGAHLLGADLGWADLKEANLRKANLEGANLREANLLGANLREASLGCADLVRADLKEANLLGANLLGANLGWADLKEANLVGANLKEANLKEANLVGANLFGANLVEANLVGANLEGANLREANLLGANLKEASLGWADLVRADLGGALNNTSLEQLSKVKTLYEAKLDENFLKSLKESNPSLFEKPSK
ncbi:Pentapeptide repeat family protein [Methanosarcina sp. MTP4]|uniref:pentapeptide repeat-containing protein n=1 Tax=Methanosarcina sp. MTP4 TaxID=1434100 RepID=UPI000615949B|nr:pentapeptide repeat-containing protein [Methanosarcina sp. MTP4]AKB25756.1 Pentapeptide repeat family protein [Methanosarcina sp. MTP4]